LGPHFFLLYVNDMVGATGELGFVLFADDTNLFAEGHNPAGLFERVNWGWLNLAGGSGVINKLIDVKSDIFQSILINSQKMKKAALVLGNHQGYGPTIVHFIERAPIPNGQYIR
jgi:hypothetical protein